MTIHLRLVAEVDHAIQPEVREVYFGDIMATRSQ